MIEIDGLNERFEGTFTFGGREYGVPFTLPGDKVQFQVIRSRRRLKIRVYDVEKAGSIGGRMETADPFCPHFGKCGGCRAQHFVYADQVRWKTRNIVEAMVRETGITPEVIPSPVDRGHRNRMDFTVDAGRVGLRETGQFTRMVDLAACPIQTPAADTVLQMLRSLLEKHPGVSFDRKTKTGHVKYATIRSGAKSGVLVLTVNQDSSASEEYKAFLVSLCAALEAHNNTLPIPFSLVHCPTPARSEVSCVPGGEAVLGPPSFREVLGGIVFDVPYDSFFQPNPAAFDVLLEKSMGAWNERAGLSNGKTLDLWDLFCGGGVLSACLVNAFPGRFRSVRGYDSTVSSIATAGGHFSRFSGPVEFLAHDLNRPEGISPGPGEDSLVVLDPPRAGFAPALCEFLTQIGRAQSLLYISCNPETQIRDIALLAPRYRPVAAFLVDCFPQTPHLEQAVLLERTLDV